MLDIEAGHPGFATLGFTPALGWVTAEANPATRRWYKGLFRM